MTCATMAGCNSCARRRWALPCSGHGVYCICHELMMGFYDGSMILDDLWGFPYISIFIWLYIQRMCLSDVMSPKYQHISSGFFRLIRMWKHVKTRRVNWPKLKRNVPCLKPLFHQFHHLFMRYCKWNISLFVTCHHIKPAFASCLILLIAS